MRNFFHRLFVAFVIALLAMAYAILQALVILLVLVPGQVLRSIGTGLVNLSTIIQHGLHRFLNWLDLQDP